MKPFLKFLSTLTVIALCGGAATAQDRIVSLGGDVTEILYELGAGDRVVATDTTSVFPQAAANTPKVGYVRRLSAEGVLSLEPDLILISGAAGPPAALEQLEASGVGIVQMETEYTVDAIYEKTRTVGDAVGKAAEAQAYEAEIRAKWLEAEATLEDVNQSLRVLFFATFADNAPRAAGRETAAHGVIELIGGTNVFGSETGYKSLSLEAAVAADPEIILVMDQNVDRAGSLEKLTSHPAISLTSAVQNGHVFVVDAVQVMQFGPRTPEALAKLATEIQDGLASDG